MYVVSANRWPDLSFRLCLFVWGPPYVLFWSLVWPPVKPCSLNARQEDAGGQSRRGAAKRVEPDEAWRNVKKEVGRQAQKKNVDEARGELKIKKENRVAI